MDFISFVESNKTDKYILRNIVAFLSARNTINVSLFGFISINNRIRQYLFNNVIDELTISEPNAIDFYVQNFQNNGVVRLNWKLSTNLLKNTLNNYAQAFEKLITVNLTNNQIGAEGMRHLSEALKA